MHLQGPKFICKIAFAWPQMFLKISKCTCLIVHALARLQIDLQDGKWVCKIINVSARLNMHLKDCKCICKIANIFSRLHMHLQNYICICKIVNAFSKPLKILNEVKIHNSTNAFLWKSLVPSYYKCFQGLVTAIW